MSKPGYPDALRVLCHDAGGNLHQVLAVACEPLPAWDLVVYLTDFADQVLLPLTPPSRRWRGRWRAGRLPPASR
jgi:hypothetical protein